MKLYSIYCSTGCSCCSFANNHSRGFYKTKEEAQEQIKEWLSGRNNPVASQYARYGHYSLREHDVETLPDGRILVSFPDGETKVYRHADYFSKWLSGY